MLRGARRFYETAGFTPDGVQKALDFYGGFPIEIRYRRDR